MIVQQILPNVPVRICVNALDKSFYFEMSNKGTLFDTNHDAVWHNKQQVLSLKGVEYFPRTMYNASSHPELVSYFGNLLYGS